MMRSQDEDQQSKLFYDLCALVLTILKLSPSISNPTRSNSSSSRRTITPSTTTRTTPSSSKVSPGGFALLLLGVSLALMLCGSVTFVIGFILMPWVLGFVMVLYFVGIVTNLSQFGRALLYPAPPPPVASSPPRMAGSPKHISELNVCELACY